MLFRSKILFVAFLLGLGISCSDESKTSSYDATDASEIVSAVGEAVKKVGEGMSPSSTTLALSEEDCTDHGDADIMQNDPNYPGLTTYCKLVINDNSPDTIQGAVTSIDTIACAMNKAGLTYDGVAKDVTLDVEPPCFSENDVEDMGETLSIRITGSKPASFNDNYTHGVIIQIRDPENTDEFYGTFKYATKVDGSTINFVSYEDFGENRTGSTAGSLDLEDGHLRVESRHERINCESEGDCGFNRHFRVYAKFDVEDGEIGELDSISFALSDTFAPPGQDSFGGRLITALGDMTSGIKARLWQATSDGVSAAPTAQADYATVSNWVEVDNDKCYLNDDEDATTCGAGLDKFSAHTKFAFTGDHTSPEDYLANITGLSFTSVALDSDTQF